MSVNSDKLAKISLPVNQPLKGPVSPFINEENCKSVQNRENECIVFSWQFFDRGHKYFNLGGLKDNWFVGLLDKLKEVSKINKYELTYKYRRAFRAHQHEWNNLSEKFNLTEGIWKQIGEDGTWQFSLSLASGRVHGFFIGNRFYIVWLDPHHYLYPVEKHGGIHTLYKQCPTEYEQKCEECDYWKKEYDKLWAEFQDFV